MHPNIDQLRQTNFDKSYLWDVEFRDFEGELFPATDINVDFWNIGTFDFNYGIFGALAVPSQLNPRGFSVTFLDDEKLKVTEWLNKWVNEEIFNKGKFVSPLLDCSKIAALHKHNSKREIIKTTYYQVVPRDGFSYRGGSDSNPNPMSVAFVIVGEQND